MAGRVPGVSQSTDDKEKQSAADKKSDNKADSTKKHKSHPETAFDASKAPPVNTPQPRTGKIMKRVDMESLGPLVNPLKGALGNDMWDGTARSTVQTFLPELPAGNTLRTVQLLTRRVLLSDGDAKLLRNDTAPKDGEDIFTLRLEKLLEMGAYKDAFDLYTLIRGEP